MVIARNIFFLFLGLWMWDIVIAIRIENATIPRMLLLMPSVSL